MKKVITKRGLMMVFYGFPETSARLVPGWVVEFERLESECKGNTYQLVIEFKDFIRKQMEG